MPLSLQELKLSEEAQNFTSSGLEHLYNYLTRVESDLDLQTLTEFQEFSSIEEASSTLLDCKIDSIPVFYSKVSQMYTIVVCKKDCTVIRKQKEYYENCL